MRIAFFLIALFCVNLVSAQNKSLLVNSGEVIAEGVKYHDDEKYDKAINKYKQVAESDTNYVLALYEMGYSYIAQKSYAEAVEVYKKAITLESPLKAASIQQLGNAYSLNKEFDKAMETYRNGLKEYPNYFRFYYEMGTACHIEKRDKEALAYIDSCLKINFGFGLAHYMMGQICQDNNYFVDAILSYQMAAYLSYKDNTGYSALIAIQKIANGETRLSSKDSIVQLFPKEENNFEDLEDIVRSKSELDSKYKVKPAISLPPAYGTIIKSLHLVNSHLGQYTDAKGWYAENLLPIYNEWWTNKEFPTIIYRMCVSTASDKNEAPLKAFKKNSEEITKQYGRFFSHFLKKKLIYESRLPGYKGEYKHLFLHDNDNLLAMIPSDETYSLSKGFSPKNGNYIFFYRNGNIRKEGFYTDGLETGVWKYYDESGNIIEVYEFTTPTDFMYTKYFSNGQPKEKRHIKDQKVIDTLYTFYSNGVTEKTIPVSQGEKVNGEVYRYYDNGQLMVITNFVNSELKDGEQINYNRDGSIESKGNMKSEKRDGEWVEYYPSGQIKQIGKYKNGKADGNWKKYHPNGTLESDNNYVNGELDGASKEYYDNGVLESEANYANGDNSGKTKRYDFDGKLYAEYVESKGKIKSATYYDKNGKVIHDVDATKNELQLTKYNVMGIKTEEGKVLKDFRTGTWNFYYDNGALYSTKEFDNKGSLNGKAEEFYVGGNIKKRFGYKKDELDGYFVEYYLNGNKRNEGYYVDGQKQGVWRRYFMNGVIAGETYFLNDDEFGMEKSFYLNGKLKSVESYKEGRFYKYTLYDTSGNMVGMDTFGMRIGNLDINYKNGNKFVDDHYTNGILNGKQITYWGNKSIKNIQERKNGQIINTEYDYYPNGKMQTQTSYKYGDEDSTYYSYDENGVLEQTLTYRYGETSGPERFYYDNGKLEVKGEHKYGEREGWVEYYAPDGHLQYRYFCIHGIEVAYSYQDKDGKFVKDIPFVNATGEFSCTFSNGNPSAKGALLNGERTGLYTKYYFNGKKSFEATYIAGVNDGLYTEYFENGKIKHQVNYIYGTKNGVEKWYDEKGNLLKETTWEYDYKNGPEKLYSAGKLIKTVNYEYDNTYDK